MADTNYSSVPPPGQSAAPVDFNALIQLAKERAAQVASGITPPPPPAAPVSASSEGAQKRSRDDGGYGYSSSEPETKRVAGAWNGDSLLSSTPNIHVGLGGQDQELMDVVATSVGVVIGKGGDNIKRVQSQSGARVQVATEAHDGVHRLVTITGDSRSVAIAKQMIRELIDEAQRGGPAAASNHLRIEITCPANKVGMIIGRGGEKIRELQARTGAHIKVLQDGAHQHAPVKPVVIQGEPQSVEDARHMIEDLIRDEPPPPPPPQHGHQPPQPGMGGPPPPTVSHGLTRVEISVPSSSVGLIIGTGGSTIKGMQNRTGARIQLQQDMGLPERGVTIEGTENAVGMAQREIDQLVDESRARMGGMGGMGGHEQRRPQRDTVRVPVPAAKVGLIIGKGGETIRSIQQETGAHVQLDRDAPPGPNKWFIIEGTHDQIEHVKRLMWDKSGAGPPMGGPGGYGPPGPPGPPPPPGYGGGPGWGGPHPPGPPAPPGPPGPYGGWGPAPPPPPPSAPGGWGAPPAQGGYSQPAPPPPPGQWAQPGPGPQGYSQPPPPPAQPSSYPGYGGGGYGGYSQPPAPGAPAPPAPPAQQPHQPTPADPARNASAAPAQGAGAQPPAAEMTEQQKVWAKQWEEYYAKMGYPQGSQPQQS